MFKGLFKKYIFFLTVLSLPFLGFGAYETLSKTHEPMATLSVEKKTDLITSLIIERLQLSKDLASYQWNEKIAIDNLDEEKAFLCDIEIQGKDLGLNQIFAKNFFTAQIEASKMIVIEHFDLWVQQNIHKHNYTPEPKALEAKIKEIDNKLLTALKDQCAFLSHSKEDYKVTLSKALQKQGFSRDVIDSATHF